MEKKRNGFWCDESIRWFIDAAEYHSFHQELGKAIIPFLNKEDQVIDLGCGLGYLTMEMAPLVKQVTAFDEDIRVLNHLQDQADKRGLETIEIQQGDWQNLVHGKRSWDVVLVSYFGRISEDYDRLAAFCRSKLIVICDEEGIRLFSSQRKDRGRKQSASEVIHYLEQRGISFQYQQIQLEFGQPLRSRGDGLAFLKWYNRRDDEEKLNKYMDQYVQRLHDELPFLYYLPKKKPMGIIVIDCTERPSRK